jgi:hypothetical protein
LRVSTSTSATASVMQHPLHRACQDAAAASAVLGSAVLLQFDLHIRRQTAFACVSSFICISSIVQHLRLSATASYLETASSCAHQQHQLRLQRQQAPALVDGTSSATFRVSVSLQRQSYAAARAAQASARMQQQRPPCDDIGTAAVMMGKSHLKPLQQQRRLSTSAAPALWRQRAHQ